MKLLFGFLWLISSWTAYGIDLPSLEQACKRASTASPPPIAKELTRFAEGEWLQFKKGEIKEADDSYIVSSGAGEFMLSWDKVYQYWIATNSLSALSFPYAISQGSKRALNRGSASEEISAVEKAFSEDPTRKEKILSTIRRSAIGSTAWSAVFISTMFKVNGFSQNEFRGAASHSLYMRSALDNADNGNIYRQLPCNPAWVKPRVGDLICYSRVTGVLTYTDVLKRHSGDRANYPFESHCDIVTNVSPSGQLLESIGGNVGNSVTKTRRYLSDGSVVSSKTESGASNNWIMVLVLKN